MPQTGRKVAFSAKQKKKQLQEKKERKANQEKNEYGIAIHRKQKKKEDINVINQQPSTSNADRNRYLLHFKRDTDEEVEKGKMLGRLPIKALPFTSLEMGTENIYPSSIQLPTRPQWSYKQSLQQLNNTETKYFNTFSRDLVSLHPNVSYWELNLETWRQLWRVLERSHIILLITDARHPVLQFPPSLHQHIINTNKKLIVVLNKVDLVPATLLLAWELYFSTHYPSIPLVSFTSTPSSSPSLSQVEHSVFKAGRKMKKRRYCSMGAMSLWEVCEEMTKGLVDLGTWKDKIENDSLPEEDVKAEVVEEDDENDDEACGELKASKKYDENSVDSDEEEDEEEEEDTVECEDREKKENGFCTEGTLTIGCCGYPNVGKSSIINTLMGKKVVSVSRTPGHTKHFQTIRLTNNVTLCDSPGLVFPSLIPKQLQILAGMYPIAQVREPYSVVRYIAERLPLHQILRLKREGDAHKSHHVSRRVNDDEDEEKEDGDKPDNDSEKLDDDAAWTAFSICDAWAEQKGFMTSRGARNDVYRAANHILRMCEQAKICLCVYPPSYHSNLCDLLSNEELKTIVKIQRNEVIVKR